MSKRVESWWTTDYDKPSGVHLPFVAPERLWCSADHHTGLVCSRHQGHGGRHAAASFYGAVWAVWS